MSTDLLSGACLIAVEGAEEAKALKSIVGGWMLWCVFLLSAGTDSNAPGVGDFDSLMCSVTSVNVELPEVVATVCYYVS